MKQYILPKLVYNRVGGNAGTWFHAKNETSETTVRNLYCLFPNIHDSLKL